jgi:hypothetical protein
VAGMEQAAGWWSREQLIARYAERTGFDVSGLRWYEVLGTFKLAVILQQIYARYAHGQTADARFAAWDGWRRRWLSARAAMGLKCHPERQRGILLRFQFNVELPRRIEIATRSLAALGMTQFTDPCQW